MKAWEAQTYWSPAEEEESVREETKTKKSLVLPDTSSVIDDNLFIILNLISFSLSNGDSITFKHLSCISQDRTYQTLNLLHGI